MIDRSKERVVIISPIRDEEKTLERTIASMEAQTHPPVLWVCVDDGSKDRTPEILAEAARRLPFMRVVSVPDRGFRKLGGGVIDAFYAGLETVDVEYDFLAKMDVDLEFSGAYIETLLRHFRNEPMLGAASGKVFRPEGEGLVEEFMIDDMVAGQFKFYRKEAFEEIGGFVREVMWDGIDFHRARLSGWITRSIPDPELRLLHLRLMGSSDKSIYRGRIRHGRGQWFMGTTLPYMAASALFRAREKPYVVGGLLMLAGYVMAALGGASRIEDGEFRRELRRWQYGRLMALLRGDGIR